MIELEIKNIQKKKSIFQLLKSNIGKNIYCIICAGFADWGMPRPMEKYPVDPNSVGTYIGLKGTTATGAQVKLATGMVVNLSDYRQQPRLNWLASYRRGLRWPLKVVSCKPD